MNRVNLFLTIAVLAAGVACSKGRYSTGAFHLAPDGNIERGKQAFLSMGCNTCHRVSGVELPAPTVTPQVPVSLGGEVIHQLSDGYLATSMLHPSYELAPYLERDIASAGQSRMPSYNDRMTTRQLTDIVTFLQAHYTVPHDDVDTLTH